MPGGNHFTALLLYFGFCAPLLLGPSDFPSSVTLLSPNTYSITESIELISPVLVDGQGSIVECGFFSMGPVFNISGVNLAVVRNLTFRNCYNRAILASTDLVVDGVGDRR